MAKTFTTRIGEVGKIKLTAELKMYMDEDEYIRQQVEDSLQRFLNGDWGNADQETKIRNDNAVYKGKMNRLRGEYSGINGGTVIIVTKKNRAATLMMLAGEYDTYKNRF